MSPLSARPGPHPRTTGTIPHRQLDQQPHDPAIRQELARRAFALPGVIEAPSAVSVPGARALVLAEDHQVGAPEAFIVGREFAHLHPAPDESLHLTLPIELARDAIDTGWAELHPLAGTGPYADGLVMVYAPRSREDLDTVWSLVAASQAFAAGTAVHNPADSPCRGRPGRRPGGS